LIPAAEKPFLILPKSGISAGVSINFPLRMVWGDYMNSAVLYFFDADLILKINEN